MKNIHMQQSIGWAAVYATDKNRSALTEGSADMQEGPVKKRHNGGLTDEVLGEMFDLERSVRCTERSMSPNDGVPMLPFRRHFAR